MRASTLYLFFVGWDAACASEVRFAYKGMQGAYEISSYEDELALPSVAQAFAMSNGFAGEEDEILHHMGMARSTMGTADSSMLGRGIVETIIMKSVGGRRTGANWQDRAMCSPTAWYPRVTVLSSDGFLRTAFHGAGEWELEISAILTHFIEPGDLVIDVGANYGVHTLAMARAVGESGHRRRLVQVVPIHQQQERCRPIWL